MLLGNGDGTFQPARTSATGPYPLSLAVGDFNADGKLDLATANYDGVTSPATTTSASCSAMATAPSPPPVPLSISYGCVSRSIATGDLNADGKLDLVVTSDDDLMARRRSVSVLLGHGDGTFAPAATYGPYYGQLLSPALADFNGDGNADVAVAGWQQFGHRFPGQRRRHLAGAPRLRPPTQYRPPIP